MPTREFRPISPVSHFKTLLTPTGTALLLLNFQSLLTLLYLPSDIDVSFLLLGISIIWHIGTFSVLYISGFVEKSVGASNTLGKIGLYSLLIEGLIAVLVISCDVIGINIFVGTSTGLTVVWLMSFYFLKNRFKTVKLRI